MPDLSVILPARDCESTIGTAVSSTLRAMPADAELVVADDASTDATAERACAGATRRGGAVDPRLRIITATPGEGGVARVLSQLLDATDSRLVARMDGDDISLPSRFARALGAIEQGDDMVFTQVVELVGRLPRPRAPYEIAPDEIGWHLLLTNPLCHPTMVSTREALDRVGGYRPVPAEDYDLWIRSAHAGAAIRRLAAWGLVYRIHPAQVTASSSWRASSWDDPDQARAFADLSESLTGERLPRLVSLVGLPAAEREDALTRFEAAIAPGIARLGGLRATRLTRRLRARIAWARAARADGGPR
ncbi:glycosyltransferase [Actinomyces sp. B33]|uniref:glycosyltransferase family 2 protein n=1 Tax=Actinomyces sp. B33 TaxID=2942131 RepID=UPI002340C360|nr:glycosyltransferase [Actinomyces sp. B33]MDC4233601.1 glycosyltransferase [Actinomyces sp. B33]